MDHLENFTFEKRKRVDILLCGSGGSPDWAQRAIGLLREYGDEIHAILPFSVSGAAALLAAGSDRLVMGRYSSLSPVNGFTYESHITGNLRKDMPEREDINLQDLRLILRRMLTKRRDKTSETALRAIEGSISGFLARDEAREVGLPVSTINSDLDDQIWNLYRTYENHLKIRHPLYASMELHDGEEKALEGLPLAIVESRDLLHVFRVDVVMRKLRRIPEDPKVEVNLNLRMPEKAPKPTASSEGGVKAEAVLARNLKSLLEKTIKNLVRKEWIRQAGQPEIVLEISRAEWETSQQPK
jgi:hypothetical protein